MAMWPCGDSNMRGLEDPAFALAVSKAMVAGKVHNQRAAAMRLIRTHPACDARAGNDGAGLAARGCGDFAGYAARAGGRGRVCLVRRHAQRDCARVRSGARQRRPPPDPINALLSLGYTLLVENVITACEIVGLDPHAGFFHTEKIGLSGWCLILMEEFRSVIVDSLVLNLVNRAMVRKQDFAPGPEGGVYLKPAALRVIFFIAMPCLQTVVRHPVAGKRLSYQKCLEVQARRLRKVIEGEVAAYEGFVTR